VLPLALSETTLDIATWNPYDLECEQTLAFVSGRRIRLALAAPGDIERHLDEVYRPATMVAKLLAGLNTSTPIEAVHESPTDTALGAHHDSAMERPMVQLVDHIVSEGITRRASDIHLEPEDHTIAVRYRIDGMLHQAMSLPKAVGIPLVSRIKIMARMDIADRLRPQGGRARVAIAGSAIDLRVSTLPATLGEKVVIRILDPRTAATSLTSLGIAPHSATRLRTLLDAREGVILVTGPTGSGKTTTLYAALQLLLERQLNIVTVEDPVEYRIPGIVQVQVNPKAGLTFAEALRSILRQDPDVVLIGEIRDRETATIAMQAALTGHLVFATLHTIDATSAITRLHDLGIEPPKIAAALKGIIAQRLLRRLCPQCATPSTDPIPSMLWDAVPSGATLLAPTGCQSCNQRGYKGRFAVTEILIPTPAIERLVAEAAPTPTLTAAVRRSGTHSLWDNGVLRLLEGDTSVDELVRVLDVKPGEESPHREAPTNSVDAPDDEWYDTGSIPPIHHSTPVSTTTPIHVGVVDVYVIDPSHTPWRTLVLQRSRTTRCPGAWEAIHGRIEPNETPEQAAERELLEETGLHAARLYNVTVHAFYLHTVHRVELAVVFCAFVDSAHAVTLSHEHTRHEWLTPTAAAERCIWPRAGQALREIEKLLSNGDAGPAEDVLRVK